MPDRPLIAVSAYWRAASWGPWSDFPASLVPQGYVLGVAAAGGLPVLVPPIPEVAEDPGAVLDAVHGLVLVGGDDIEPARYGAEPHPLTDPPNRLRDAAELALLRGALDRRLPVLGICRGVQLLNVVRGGDLVQHIADVTPLPPHRERMGLFGRHDVEVTGGRLRELLGDRVSRVSSHHHQGLGTIGAGLVPTATAHDGQIEALEDPEQPFCVGVLWHPEEDALGSGQPLFAGLVAAARERAAAGEGHAAP